MGQHDGSKLFALRVQNISRSCILLKQFTKGIWTMPIATIPFEDDPMDHLPAVLNQVATDDKFEIISVVSMLDWMQEDSKDVEHHSIIYDLRYVGKVLPHLTDYDKADRYKTSKWVQKGMLDTYRDNANYPLYAYLLAKEKEECLR